MKEKKTVAQDQKTLTTPSKATQPVTLQRVVTRLTREQLDWMDNFAKDAYFATGYALHRMQILAALVEVARLLGINGKGLKGPEDIVEYLQAQLQFSGKKGKEGREGKEVKQGESSLRGSGKLGRIIKELKSDEKP